MADISADELDAMLEKPKLEIAKAPEVVDPEKLRQEAEKRRFDEIMAGGFAPDILAAAAKEQYAVRMPQFISQAENVIKKAAAHGSCVADMPIGVAPNFQTGIIDYLEGKGFKPQVKMRGTPEATMIIPLYDDMPKDDDLAS